MTQQEINDQITKLKASGELSKRAAKRLSELLALQAQELAAAAAITDFRSLEHGTVTPHGVAQLCPVCQETGVARQPKWANGMTMIAHSLECVPTIADIIISSNGKKWTEVGASGRYRLTDDYHMLTAQGVPVVAYSHTAAKIESNGATPARRKPGAPEPKLDCSAFFNNRPLKLNVAIPVNQLVDIPKAEPPKGKAPAKKGEPVAEWRRAAAAKAWVTIRAKRAQALAAV